MKNLKAFYIEHIDGHKTDVTVAVTGLLNIAQQLNLISVPKMAALNALLGTLIGIFVRDAIRKTQ